MFRVAQWVVRHKVLVVGVAAAGFIFLGGNDEPEKPSNPWAAGAVETSHSTSSSSKKSIVSKAYGAVAGAAKEYAGVDIGGVDPQKLQDSTKENFSNAEKGMKAANGN